MRRRRFCTTVLLATVSLAGCLSGGGTETPPEATQPPEATPTQGGTATPTTDAETPTTDSETSTPTETNAPTDTVPPLTRTLEGLRVVNERDSAVTLDLTISARKSDDSRTLTVELAAGEHRDFDDLSILDRPVTVAVTVAGATYEHAPTGQGRLLVRVTPDGVAFAEIVT